MIDQEHERGAMEIHYAAGGRTGHRRWVWLAGSLVALAAVVAGLVVVLGGGRSNTPKANDAASASGPGRSPYALNNDPPPSLAGAYSDNLKTAFLALYAYHVWLFQHPNAALVKNYAVPGSPGYQIDEFNVKYLLAHGLHNPPRPGGYDADVQYVRVTKPPTPIMLTQTSQETVNGHLAYGPGVVTVVFEFVDESLYSATGRAVQPGQSAGFEAESISLEQGPDGQWRTYQAVALHPPGGPLSLEK